MSPSDKIEESTAPLIEHLTELRQRLIYSVLAFLVGMIICFTIWNPIFHFLTQPICISLAERSQAQRLINEHEMGELFKVVGFATSSDWAAQGFARGDRSHRL